MKYKAIISDLDGTLLNSDHKISSYTKKVINKIIDSGIKFYIATGRHHIDVAAIKKILDIETLIITSNGARVHNRENVEILSYDLPIHISKEILNLEIDKTIHVNFYSSDSWYAERENSKFEGFSKETGFKYQVVKFENLKNINISKFFYYHDDQKVIENLEQFFKNIYGNQLNIATSSANCLEIMAEGVSKGVALKKVLELENLNIDETIAFGDELNDLEMLNIVGKGYIMKNGNKILKQLLPNLEIVESNDDNGVAKKIEEILSNN